MGGASNSSTGTTKAKAGSGAVSLRTGAFTVSIPKDMAAQAAKAAEAMGITRAQFVKQAVQSRIEYEEWALKQIDAGLEELKAGKGIPHDEFWKRIDADIEDARKKAA